MHIEIQFIFSTPTKLVMCFCLEHFRVEATIILSTLNRQTTGRIILSRILKFVILLKVISA